MFPPLPKCYCILTTTYVATSINVKQVFSKGQLILLHIFNWLTVASTCTLMCLSAWSKLGLVHDADLLTAATLPDVMEDEGKFNVGWDYIAYD